MGVKGCGEVGTIGSPAAVTNAVVDALSQYGVSRERVRQIEVRAFEKLQKAMRAAARAEGRA